MTILAVAALMMAVLGWISMGFILKWPSLRRTMWPCWMLHVGSVLLAVGSLASFGVPMLSINTVFVLGAVASFVLFLIVFMLALRIPSANGRPEVGQPLPDFSITLENGKSISARDVVTQGPTLLVFFRGFWCLSCTDELQGLASVRDALRKKGGDILAISADKLAVLQSGHKRVPNLPCQVACDPGAESVSALHLLQSNMAKIGKKVSVPANVLVDRNGIVRWTHYAGIVMDRPDPRQVLSKVMELV